MNDTLTLADVDLATLAEQCERAGCSAAVSGDVDPRLLRAQYLAVLALREEKRGTAYDDLLDGLASMLEFFLDDLEEDGYDLALPVKRGGTMRKVGIVSIHVAVDLSAGGDPLASAADLLQSVLTAQMQKFNEGKGALVDWTFASDEVRIVDAPDADEYKEGEIF